MRSGDDLFCQLRLRPPKPPNRLEIPAPGLHIQVSLQDDNILCPANFHGLVENLWVALVHPVKVPHPTKAAGGEAGPVGIVSGNILRCHHSGPLFRPAAYQPAQLQIQFHLGKVGGKSLIDSGVKFAVINVLPNVHVASPFWAYCPIWGDKAKEKAAVSVAALCFGLSPTVRSPVQSQTHTGGRRGSDPWKVPLPYPPADGWRSPPTQ